MHTAHFKPRGAPLALAMTLVMTTAALAPATARGQSAPAAEERGPPEELDLAALLENVVVTATKSELKEDEAPAITTVISRDEINRWAYHSVAEVLDHVAGVYLIDDHALPSLGIRGVSGGLRSESGLVKVMIDARSVAFRSTAGNWLGAELIPMSAIHQIEIIRGPASALYGADAFLGVINIVTRHADQVEGGEVALTAAGGGAANGFGQDATVATTGGRWELLASYRHLSEERTGLVLPSSSPAPTLPSYAPADRRAHGLSQLSDVALGTLNYRISSTADLKLVGYFSAVDRQAEFADWAQLTHNLDSQGRDNGTNISLHKGFLGLELAVRPSARLDLRFNNTVFAGSPTARDRIDVASDLFYIRRDFGYRGLESKAEATFRPIPAITSLLGAELTMDQEDLPAIYHVMKGDSGDLRAGEARLVSVDNGQVTLWNPALNGLIFWQPPSSRISVIAGARYDYHNIYGGKPSARLGGVLALASALHLKLLYGSAFKAPSPQLIWGQPLVVGDIAGNRRLKPSYVHTVEAQLTYRPATSFSITTGLAYSRLLDQAEFELVGINQVAHNVAQVQSLSWESELKFEWRRKYAAYANLSINRTRRQVNEPGYAAMLADYPNIAYPLAVAHGGASAALPRLPLRIGAEATCVSPRSSSASNALSAGGRYTLPAYLLLNTSVRTSSLELLSQRETWLTLSVRNLLGASIVDPGNAGVDYPRVGRTILLQLTQQL